MKHFDHLFNTIMEEVKSSKKHLIKENKSTEYRKTHCMTVGQLKAALAQLDPSTPIKYDTPFANLGTNNIKYVDDEYAPDYATLHSGSEAMTASELINELSKFADNVFAAVYEDGCRWDSPEYIKALEGDTIIGDDESFTYNWQGRRCTLEESVEKPVRRHARRHLIKEWSYDDFVRVNKERIQKIFNRLFSNPETKKIYK